MGGVKQRIDEHTVLLQWHTGLLQWKVAVSDPSAEKDREKSISVTMLARVQPVPPETAIVGFDFRPVYFEDLTIEPRVMGEKLSTWAGCFGRRGCAHRYRFHR